MDKAKLIADQQAVGGFHEDDRAQRVHDIFSHLPGQVNMSIVHSTSHIVAWHRHKKQTDYWICLKGSFKVGLAEPVIVSDGSVKNLSHCEVRFEYLSDKRFRVLHIPPGVWHGYRAIEPGSILLYYVTHKYRPSDEYRKEVGEFDESWDTHNK